jgi:hypothetical protein
MGCVRFTGKKEASPLKLTRIVSLPGVEGRIDHFALNSTGERLF